MNIDTTHIFASVVEALVLAGGGSALFAIVVSAVRR